ncbi:MAG: MBOAT family protein [Muribaculaceae bacterium]|nr:MBOAT family protein [Muribaculaceae bacterium]
MLFNSIEFLIFLPIVFILYWCLSGNLRAQNLFIVSASYIFYGWWDWRFLFLIFFITTVSFTSGILLETYDGRRPIRRAIVTLTVIICLGVLCTFKYFDFFSINFAKLLGLFGIELDAFTLGLVLPVGISFYTLQALSYTIDVYRKRIPATRDVISFYAFISFFPQLVAGPIERASNLLPQFLNRRRFSYSKGVEGLQQILWGLFKKMVVADNCAKAVNVIYGNYEAFDGGMLIWGAILFSFQIYGDFSGYSDIAIGAARLFGINLSRNFHYPYLSRNVAEFWRRWHVSLNRWFVDYVYIPLGGSRGTMRLTIFNTLMIFLLSGFWHGADWSYICWGLFNAIFFIPLILLGTTKKYRKTVVAQGRYLPRFIEVIQLLTTFCIVTFGRIFFRAENMSHALGYLTRIFTHFKLTIPWDYLLSLKAIAILFIVEWCQRHREFGLQLSHDGLLRYRAVRWAVYYAVFLLIIFWSDTPEEFIYFQF